MVDLRDFVRQTIVDVLRGISDAQDDFTVGKRVAPPVSNHAKISPEFGVAWHDGAMWSIMKFDIAITAETSKEGAGGAKAGIKVVAIEASLGGEKKSAARDETVSRIQFPVHFRLDQEQ